MCAPQNLGDFFNSSDLFSLTHFHLTALQVRSSQFLNLLSPIRIRFSSNNLFNDGASSSYLVELNKFYLNNILLNLLNMFKH